MNCRVSVAGYHTKAIERWSRHRVRNRSNEASDPAAVGHTPAREEFLPGHHIYGQPTEVILDMLKQAAGVDVPVTILPEYLGGFTRN